MNKERLMILANWLLAGAPHKHIKFDMCHTLKPKWVDDNPTDINEDIESCTACIAGCANLFFESEGVSWVELTSQHRAMNILDLTDDQATQLFYACSYSPKFHRFETEGDPEFSKISPEFAGTVIKNFVETGKINWHLKQFMDS